ncbi:MAG: FkbM family methyltransferase [Bryobacteraceae bacterium]
MSQFYSQNGEDRILSRMFSDVGTCVEVGAHDGVYLSNTYHFEERGWQCILVEPNGELCAKIRQSRRASVFECAKSESCGELILYEGSGEDDLYSTLEAPTPGSPQRFRAVVVQTRTLDSILEEAGVDSLDFITIDVEGHESRTLRGLTLSRWKPRLVLLEDNSDFAEGEVERHMRHTGYYRFWRSGANDWYAGKSVSRVWLLSRILFSDCFSLQGFLKGMLPRQPVRKLLLVSRLLRKARVNSPSEARN